MASFYLIRHGKQDHAAIRDRNFIGHGLELAPLTEEGISQVEECSRDPRLNECSLIITSPYTRTMQTAAILSKNMGLDIKVEIDLREQELDLTYQAGSIEELKNISLEEQKYNGSAPKDKVVTWETRDNVRKRVTHALIKYAGYGKVIVVCHGMVIHCMTGAVGIPNCSIFKIDLDERSGK